MSNCFAAYRQYWGYNFLVELSEEMQNELDGKE